MLNNITICGRLVATPELRHTGANIPVSSFCVAVDRDGKDKETDFFDCIAWRNQAKFICDYFKKGQMIILKGRMQFRTRMLENGTSIRHAELVVEDVYFGSVKPASYEGSVQNGAGSES